MIELKLAYRNLRRDFSIYSLMIVSAVIFISLIVGFQSIITNGALGEMLAGDSLTDNQSFFRMILIAVAVSQYVILIFFFRSYYRIIAKVRVRELSLYKIIGYTRMSIRKTIFIESGFVYLIISGLTLVTSVVFNKLLISFVNSYLDLTTKLSGQISLHAYVISIIFLGLIMLVSTHGLYRKAIKVDIEQALNDDVSQKQVKLEPKTYIFINLVIGLILIGLMTYLSTIATLSLKYGVIIIAIFYAIGLYLIIDSFASGYRYLAFEKYQKRGFNRLLVAETNFQLNKSKLVILSSMILIMMSIGSLLLSQAIAKTLNDAVAAADFRIYATSLDVNLQNFGVDYRVSANGQSQEQAYFNIYPTEITNVVDRGYQAKDYTVYMSPDYAAGSGVENGDIVSFNSGDEQIDFTVVITDAEHSLSAYVPFSEMKNYEIFSTYLQFISKLEPLYTAVSDGDASSVMVTERNVSLGEQGVSVIAESNFNEYLQLIGEKPIDITGDQVWEDGDPLYMTSTTDLNIVGHSENALNVMVVDDKVFEQLTDDNPSDYDFYIKAVDQQTGEKLNQSIETGYGIINLTEYRNEVLGNNAFLLLVAFYLAVIFIITNFTLLAISLCSHGIESEKLYQKMSEMGIDMRAKGKYISKFIRTMVGFPLVIGVISGLIATKFALKLTLDDRGYNFDNLGVLIVILILYLITYILFISITKHIYKRIVSAKN